MILFTGCDGSGDMASTGRQGNFHFTLFLLLLCVLFEIYIYISLCSSSPHLPALPHLHICLLYLFLSKISSLYRLIYLYDYHMSIYTYNFFKKQLQPRSHVADETSSSCSPFPFLSSCRWGLLLPHVAPQCLTGLDFALGPPGWLRLPLSSMRRNYYSDFYSSGREKDKEEEAMGITEERRKSQYGHSTEERPHEVYGKSKRLGIEEAQLARANSLRQEKVIAWCISRRYWYNDYYEDIEGMHHPTEIGVTTLFTLRNAGSDIKFADPWVVPKFNHRVASPLRNRFLADNLSVAASTLFVIGKNGRMFTRLVDFDTEGHNPFLEYRWREVGSTGPTSEEAYKKRRRLPNEQWREQPPVLPATMDLSEYYDSDVIDYTILPHRVSTHITIVQTGQGNAARELRVFGWIVHRDKRNEYAKGKKSVTEAVGSNYSSSRRLSMMGSGSVCGDDEKEYGFFKKDLFGSTWTFHPMKRRRASPWERMEYGREIERIGEREERVSGELNDESNGEGRRKGEVICEVSEVLAEARWVQPSLGLHSSCIAPSGELEFAGIVEVHRRGSRQKQKRGEESGEEEEDSDDYDESNEYGAERKRDVKVHVRVSEFNPYCSPAKLTVSTDMDYVDDDAVDDESVVINSGSSGKQKKKQRRSKGDRRSPFYREQEKEYHYLLHILAPEEADEVGHVRRWNGFIVPDLSNKHSSGSSLSSSSLSPSPSSSSSATSSSSSLSAAAAAARGTRAMKFLWYLLLYFIHII